ncbi:MAG: SDR family oxidoreductase [Chloroflexota bacterium]
MSRNNLVIGASGQVGEHCVAALRAADRPVQGTYRQHPREGMIALDTTDVQQFDHVLEQTEPGVMYLMAATANVDYCEEQPEIAYRTNVNGTKNAVDLANRHGCKLIYFSTEYVFDGVAGPYPETAPAHPICEYGRQKLAAEHYIALFAENWLIVRTTVVYSWESQGKNFLYRLRNTLREGKTLTVPSDQVSSPTYAPDLVQAVIQLAEQDERGVFHVCGSQVADRYEFALAAAAAFGLDASLIVPVLTADLKQVAPRPLKAGMLVDKVEQALGRRMIGFEEGLREMALNSP